MTNIRIIRRHHEKKHMITMIEAGSFFFHPHMHMRSIHSEEKKLFFCHPDDTTRQKHTCFAL